jgi:hypothetical protein
MLWLQILQWVSGGRKGVNPRHAVQNLFLLRSVTLVTTLKNISPAHLLDLQISVQWSFSFSSYLKNKLHINYNIKSRAKVRQLF